MLGHEATFPLDGAGLLPPLAEPGTPVEPIGVCGRFGHRQVDLDHCRPGASMLDRRPEERGADPSSPSARGHEHAPYHRSVTSLDLFETNDTHHAHERLAIERTENRRVATVGERRAHAFE